MSSFAISSATATARSSPGTGTGRDELLRQEPLDLVVLDVMLPGLDGLALSRSIRVSLVASRSSC